MPIPGGRMVGARQVGNGEMGAGALRAGGDFIVYLLRDLFTTDRAAGAINGTPAEPGPGTRTTIDTESKLTISGGKLVCSGGKAVGSWSDPVSRHSAITRKAGLILHWHFNQTTVPAANGSISGFSNNVTPSNATYPQMGVRLASASTIFLYDGSGGARAVALYSALTDYEFAIVTRGTGTFVFIKGGLFGSTWTLLYVFSTGTDATLYPAISDFNIAYSSEFMQVMDRSATPWGTDDGIVIGKSASPSANATIGGLPSCVVEFTWTPQAAQVEELKFRYADDDNCWILRCTQADGTIKLFAREVGVETEVDAGKTQTWTVGTPYRIVILNAHKELRTWVNDVPKHLYTGTTARVDFWSNNIKTTLAGANLKSWPRFVNLLNGTSITPLNIDRAYASRAAAPLNIATYDGSNEITHPDVYDAGEGQTWNGHRYWALGTPYPFDASVENPCVYYSDDGLAWTGIAGNPIDPTPAGGAYNSDTDLLMVGGTLYAFYRESESGVADRIKVRASTDGETWSAEQDLFATVGSAKCVSPALVEYNGQYLMFSVNASGGRTLERRTCATPNGTWSAPATCTLAGAGAATLWHINVVNDGGRLYMLWTNDSFNLYTSYSDDGGLTWATQADTTIAASGAAIWDKFIYRVAPVKRTYGFDLWYGAHNGGSPAHYEVGFTRVVL